MEVAMSGPPIEAPVEATRSSKSPRPTSNAAPVVIGGGSSEDGDSILSAHPSRETTPVKKEPIAPTTESEAQPGPVKSFSALPPVPVLRREGRTGAYFPEDKAKAIEYFLRHSRVRGIDKKKAAEELGVKYITLYQWVRDSLERDTASHAMKLPFLGISGGFPPKRPSDTPQPYSGSAPTPVPARQSLGAPFPPFSLSNLGGVENVKRRRTDDPSPPFSSPFGRSASSSDGARSLQSPHNLSGQRITLDGGFFRSRGADTPPSNWRPPHIRAPRITLESDDCESEEAQKPPSQVIRRTFGGAPPIQPPRAPSPLSTTDGKYFGQDRPPQVHCSSVDGASHLPDCTIRQSKVSNSKAETTSMERSAVECCMMKRSDLQGSRVESSEVLQSVLLTTTVRESYLFQCHLTNCLVENSRIMGGVYKGRVFRNVEIDGSDEKTTGLGNGA